MKLPGNKTIFGIALLVGALPIIGLQLYSRHQQPQPDVSQITPILATRHLHGEIWVSEQISPQSIATLKQQGIQSIIAMRPDGEVENQPTAAAMEQEAQKHGLKFSYIPIPHGDIPEARVKDLQNILAKTEGPVLMYCRSGSRAARTWSLAEASRAGGLDLTTILGAVKSAGLKAEDLQPLIEQRIATRNAGGKS
ncbi:TIGR01244 family sulfur transferase [Undibacterium sp. Di27W]|uniref:TIGR01244 family sulfur transferase n=1 Tax=Undibacterium sp. Di27W TaxID=3413036 RepID=UPI003BF1401A